MTTFINGFPNALTGQPIDENSKAIVGTYKNISSGNGTVTTSGTPVQVRATSTEAKAIDILNPASNSGVLVIGDSTVSYASNIGIPIQPAFSYRIQITDASKVWVDAQVNGSTFQFNLLW